MIKFSSEWKPINPDDFALIGTDYTIEDRTNGMLYVTSKAYMNKLLSIMGYRNVNVLKILNEFAGKIVSDIGTIEGYKIYVNNATSSFIVVSDDAVEWYENFTDQDYIDRVSIINYDNLLTWDQINPNPENGFSFNLDMVGEKMYLLSYSISDGVIIAIGDEGSYDMKDPDSLDILNSIVELGSLTSSRPDPDKTMLSIEETMSLITKLGYTKKRRHGYVMTGKMSPNFNVEELVIKYNSNKWIARRILDGITLQDAYKTISEEPEVRLWDFKDLYIEAFYENLDCDNSKF